jgi:hypothetical protein
MILTLCLVGIGVVAAVLIWRDRQPFDPNRKDEL